MHLASPSRHNNECFAYLGPRESAVVSVLPTKTKKYDIVSGAWHWDSADYAILSFFRKVFYASVELS